MDLFNTAYFARSRHAVFVCISILYLVFIAVPASALESVTLQLKWTHAFQFAGYYAAKEMGFYREAGLDVDIKEANPKTDPVQEIVSGLSLIHI